MPSRQRMLREPWSLSSGRAIGRSAASRSTGCGRPRAGAWSGRSSSSIIYCQPNSNPVEESTFPRTRTSAWRPSPISSKAKCCTATASAANRPSAPVSSTGCPRARGSFTPSEARTANAPVRPAFTVHSRGSRCRANTNSPLRASSTIRPTSFRSSNTQACALSSSRARHSEHAPRSPRSRNSSMSKPTSTPARRSHSRRAWRARRLHRRRQRRSR